jgi:hypothetical protein
VYETDPFPLPLAPEAIDIHGTPLDALHGHPAPAVTLTVFFAPAAGTLAPFGDREIEHPPACVTVNV